MPFASYQSIEGALSELEAAYSDESRRIGLCLTFRRKSTTEELLTVGGVWDRHARQWADVDGRALVVAVNDNQVAVVKAFARYLRARLEDAPRKPFLVTGGNRRGGKSWIVTALGLAMAVAIPGAIVWFVSPTLDKREELERYLKSHAAPGWLVPLVREFKFTLPHGSTIKNITGDDEDSLKRGEADLVVYNEPQLMAQGVIVNGAPAVIDQGGLVLFAGNPAQKRKGVWFTRLWRAIESGKYPHGEVHRLDKRDNPDINREAASQIGELIRLVDPAAARADDEGVFMEPGSFAYAESFDEDRNTAPGLPDIAPVCTGAVMRKNGVSARDMIAGVDFQGWPHNAGVSIEATGDPRAPVYYVTACLLREDDEDYFLDDAFELWPQDRLLFIGDASGTWQDAKHTRGRCSFDKFKARRWRIEPPRIKRSDRGTHPANPPVEDRVNLVNRLLDDGRLIVCMDKAAPVAEALAKCEVDTKGKPRGLYAHVTDALGYVLYWLEPQPRQRTQARRGAAYSLPVARTPTNLF